MDEIQSALARTDWALLAQQKQTLVDVLNANAFAPAMQDHLDGLLAFLDAVQDAAEKDGHPVIFLTEDES